MKSDGSADTDDIDGTDNPNGVVLTQTRGVAHGPNVGVGPKPAARAKNHETGDWSELSSSLLAKTASSIVAELGRVSAAISGQLGKAGGAIETTDTSRRAGRRGGAAGSARKKAAQQMRSSRARTNLGGCGTT